MTDAVSCPLPAAPQPRNRSKSLVQVQRPMQAIPHWSHDRTVCGATPCAEIPESAMTATQLLSLLTEISIILIVLSTGMAGHKGDLTYLLRRPSLLLRSLLSM